MKRLGREKLFFPACPGFGDIERRPDTAVCQPPVEDQFHVTSSLELLEDQLIHTASGINESGTDNRQGPPSLVHPGRRENLFGDIHRFDVNPAAHRTAGIPHPFVECTGQTGDRVEEKENILPLFGEAFAPFGDKLRYPDMTFKIAVQAARHNLSTGNRTPEICNLLWTFINQKNDDVDIRIIGDDRLTDLLEENRFSGSRRKREACRRHGTGSG